MFLNKLFSSKKSVEESNTSNNNQYSKEVKKGIWYFAKKIWMILWISAALQSNPVLSQENHIQKEDISQEVATHQKEEEIKKIKLAKAISWDSVEGFMIRSFWVSTWWELLVWKDWSRIENPKTDLIAWKEYILARDEKEAKTLVKMFSKKSQIKKVEKLEEKNWDKKEQVKKTKKLSAYDISYKDVSEIGFDFSSYLKAISWVESSWNYKANNSEKWIKYKVSKSKYAKWAYQFTRETLVWFWIDTEEKIKKYLNSPSLQDKIMEKFTMSNYDYAINNPYISTLLDSWVHISQILATMHHRWSYWTEQIAKYAVKHENPKEAFFHRLSKVKWDWLWTKTSDYIKSVWLKYSQMVWGEIEEKQLIIAKREKPEPKKLVSTISSNDEKFKVEVSVKKQNINDKIQLASVSQVELIDQTPEVDVSVVLKQHYKTELLSKLSKMNFPNLSQDAKAKLIDKLSKVDDLEAYYKTQIDYHKNIISTSANDLERQKSKKILVWLEKLLSDTTKIIQASNDDYSSIRKSA